MKLKAKFQDEDFDLGEVVEVLDIAYGADGAILLKADAKRGGRTTFAYKTLAELNEEWEDVPEEELKVYWYILGSGEIRCIEDIGNDFDHAHKEIGNYFETEEEAEKAVEKLKAWKRLKDKGFEFTDWNVSLGELYFKVPGSFFPDEDFITVETRQDLDLLFRGEE